MVVSPNPTQPTFCHKNFEIQDLQTLIAVVYLLPLRRLGVSNTTYTTNHEMYDKLVSLILTFYFPSCSAPLSSKVEMANLVLELTPPRHSELVAMTPEAFLGHLQTMSHLKRKASLKLGKATESLRFDPAPTAEDKTVATTYVRQADPRIVPQRSSVAGGPFAAGGRVAERPGRSYCK